MTISDYDSADTVMGYYRMHILLFFFCFLFFGVMCCLIVGCLQGTCNPSLLCWMSECPGRERGALRTRGCLVELMVAAHTGRDYFS